MLKSRRTETLVAFILIAPFVAIYGWMFLYPTLQMVELSFTNAPLIGPGDWVGIDNYIRLFGDRIFLGAIWNTAYFVLLTVIPGTIAALAIALMVSRLKGWAQSLILSAFFLPYVLPITVVFLIWQWMLDTQFGILQQVIEPIMGQTVNVFRRLPWFMPTVAILTIWWTNGFSILLFEAAQLDGATRRQVFFRITWPLIWPITVLCLTIQLILQLKIFDQVYLFAQGGRTQATMTLVQYIFDQAFVKNAGGYASTAAVALFVIVIVFSVFQYQVLRIRGAR